MFVHQEKPNTGIVLAKDKEQKGAHTSKDAE
jgi:hypothetical protein